MDFLFASLPKQNSEMTNEQLRLWQRNAVFEGECDNFINRRMEARYAHQLRHPYVEDTAINAAIEQHGLALPRRNDDTDEACSSTNSNASDHDSDGVSSTSTSSSSTDTSSSNSSRSSEDARIAGANVSLAPHRQRPRLMESDLFSFYYTSIQQAVRMKGLRLRNS